MLIEKYNDLFTRLLEKVDFEPEISKELKAFRDEVAAFEERSGGDWEQKYNDMRQKYYDAFMTGVNPVETVENQPENEDVGIESLLVEEE